MCFLTFGIHEWSRQPALINLLFRPDFPVLPFFSWKTGGEIFKYRLGILNLGLHRPFGRSIKDQLLVVLGKIEIRQYFPFHCQPIGKHKKFFVFEKFLTILQLFKGFPSLTENNNFLEIIFR